MMVKKNRNILSWKKDDSGVPPFLEKPIYKYTQKIAISILVPPRYLVARVPRCDVNFQPPVECRAGHWDDMDGWRQVMALRLLEDPWS